MDEETQLVVAPDDSSPPALNEAERLAKKVVAALDVLASHLNLETPHPKTARRVRGSRTVSPEFVASLIDSVEALPKEFGSFGTFNAGEAREVMQSREAMRSVSAHIAMFLAKVNYTIEARWSEVASAAMLTYTLAGIRAKNPASAELAVHVEKLRRILARTNRKKQKKKEE